MNNSLEIRRCHKTFWLKHNDRKDWKLVRICLNCFDERISTYPNDPVQCLVCGETGKTIMATNGKQYKRFLDYYPIKTIDGKLIVAIVREGTEIVKDNPKFSMGIVTDRKEIPVDEINTYLKSPEEYTSFKYKNIQYTTHWGKWTLENKRDSILLN